MTPLSWLTARLAAYLILAAVVLSVVGRWEVRADGRLEERERQAVTHAIQWHRGYMVAKDSIRKSDQRARRAVATSAALRDSVRVLSDSSVLVLPDSAEIGSPARPDTVYVPRIVVRRLVADSVTISRLTLLTEVQGTALVVADSTIAAYQVALEAAQKAGSCRVFRVVPCPSRKTVALLTAGGLLVVKLTIGAAP